MIKFSFDVILKPMSVFPRFVLKRNDNAIPNVLIYDKSLKNTCKTDGMRIRKECPKPLAFPPAAYTGDAT